MVKWKPRCVNFYCKFGKENDMGKKQINKTDLLKEIELKVQDLNLLQSALKADRSRKPETLAMYEQKFLDLLKR
jgi:hypothetical protein